MELGGHFKSLSADDFDPTLPGYRRRTVFSKSKSGCRACKLKRVKCDEETPVCRRCRRNSRLCLYGIPEERSGSTTVLATPYRTEHFSILSATTVAPFPLPSPKSGTSSIHVMQHLQRHWGKIFPMPRSNEILKLSKSNTLVLNTILAIAACHLRTVSPGARANHIAEHFQTYMALQGYRHALETPPEQLSLVGANTLLLAATLLNMGAFALPGTETAADGQADMAASWVFSTGDNRLGWMALQAGLRPLLISMQPYQDQITNHLGSIFLGAGGTADRLHEISHSLHKIPDHWVEAFKVSLSTDDSGCESSEVYRVPVIVLANLRHLEPVPSNVFLYLMFMSKMNRQFRALLFNRDERALWLVGYWLGLMRRFETLWWCEQRAKRDYQAVCLWLAKLHLPEEPGEKGRIWTKLMDDLVRCPWMSPESG